MARPKSSKASKGAKAKAPKATKTAKPVDQEIKGGKKPKEAVPDKGPLSGTGHNLTAVKKLVVPYAERYNRILDEKASNAASYMADARVLIEDAANDLGCKKSVIREALQRNRRIHKDAEKDAERDRDELSQRDTIEDALGHYSDTPLGAAAVKREKAEAPAKPEKPKKTEAKAEAPKKRAASNGNGKVVQMPVAEEASDDDDGEDTQDDKGVPAAA